MNITIDKEILKITPNFSIGVMCCDVTVYENKELFGIMKKLEEEIANDIDISEVINLSIIKEGRKAYKAYGKDPSRYRLAV